MWDLRVTLELLEVPGACVEQAHSIGDSLEAANPISGQLITKSSRNLLGHINVITLSVINRTQRSPNY